MRTLDQQCTVTRPGLSNIAGSLAVELMVALLNHPQQASAPADPELDMFQCTQHPLGTVILHGKTHVKPLLNHMAGLVPHQIRGWISHFSQKVLSAPRYLHCTACSGRVQKQLDQHGFDFIRRVLAQPQLLESISGLEQVGRGAWQPPLRVLKDDVA